ncbi:LysR family transcriptional regulator [Burkholderia humptydooensis]|uniref:LysR family transcriptional regulator n=2 Tax=Burkholderia humptydooensis TaxID=430531 RepID=A0A7U4P8U6_9BURK|nr:lysR substrate binding domain protein [Burkholderia sp. 2002721687]ALX45099.1 LysR family transcriptional regulator [Burkholderia humptydooensis]EIP85533.1 transcriptional regulator, LysR family protein [Burkholderia humptydooensis MSMB43]QPS46556.1 LysR family transcriptional regulator [Burkholderia humptydooensis]
MVELATRDALARALAGLGVALLPHFIVAAALDAGRLVTVLEPFAQAPLPVNAMYPQHRQDMAACRAADRPSTTIRRNASSPPADVRARLRDLSNSGARNYSKN